MNVELLALYSAGIMTFFLVLIQGTQVPINFGFKWGLGNRDDPRAPTAFMLRTERTLDNQLQAMAIAIPVFILVIIHPDAQNSITMYGAYLFVLGRIGFIVCYLLGIPIWRSVIWGVGMVGTLMVAFGGLSAFL